MADGTAGREARAEAIRIGFAGGAFEGGRGVEGAVLDEEERVAVLDFRAGTSFDVDRAASRAAGLGGVAVVDELKVADGFGGELGTAEAGVLVVVVDAVDVEGVAGGAEASGAESSFASRVKLR